MGCLFDVTPPNISFSWNLSPAVNLRFTSYVLTVIFFVLYPVFFFKNNYPGAGYFESYSNSAILDSVFFMNHCSELHVIGIPNDDKNVFKIIGLVYSRCDFEPFQQN